MCLFSQSWFQAAAQLAIHSFQLTDAGLALAVHIKYVCCHFWPNNFYALGPGFWTLRNHRQHSYCFRRHCSVDKEACISCIKHFHVSYSHLILKAVQLTDEKDHLDSSCYDLTLRFLGKIAVLLQVFS